MAQLVARRSHNPKVVSSILTRRTFDHAEIAIAGKRMRLSGFVLTIQFIRNICPAASDTGASECTLTCVRLARTNVHVNIPEHRDSHILQPNISSKGETQKKTSRGFEPRSLDSESRVLTVTPRGPVVIRRMRPIDHATRIGCVLMPIASSNFFVTG